MGGDCALYWGQTSFLEPQLDNVGSEPCDQCRSEEEEGKAEAWRGRGSLPLGEGYPDPQDSQEKAVTAPPLGNSGLALPFVCLGLKSGRAL